MSEERKDPWGTILVVLTVLAVVHYWFQPFAGEEDPPTAGLVGEQPDPMVRRTHGWTPPERASITPGIQTITGSAGQCTTNFVFTDRAGHVYLGQAAHCARLDERGTDGCRTPTLPLGTRVLFTTGASSYDLGEPIATGRLAYSSWRAMQRRDESRPHLCAYNDFALVRLPERHRALVNPTVPFWGGPTGLAWAGVSSGEHVFGFGRSSLRGESSPYSRQAAVAMADRESNRGWSHTISSRSPGIPGDSGSAYVDSDGRALGTLSTLSIGVLFVTNGLGDLSMELAYARRHSGIEGLRLELGTERFRRHRAESWARGETRAERR